MSSAGDTRSRSPDGTAIWPALVWLVFAVLFVWAAIGSNGTYDTYRDIFMAESIVTGTGYPLNGPTINNVFHLGPAWFYLLALPLWLIRNPAMVNATMGLLGALQFPLAYRIGLRFGTRRLAFLFALALALPGWSAFPLVQLTHVTTVSTCVLFGALAALRYREYPSAVRAAVLGLAIGCMLHAHPTTLLLAALCAVAAVQAAPPRQRILHALSAGLAALALFTPMLVHQALNAWPDFTTVSSYATTRLALPSPTRAAGLLLALLDYGADNVTRFWLAAPKPVLRILLIVNALCFIFAAAGVLLSVTGDAGRRRWIGALVGVFFAQTLFVIALREITPFWMIYAHLPIIAALVAMGLDRICTLGRNWRIVTGALALTWTLWSIATWLYLASSPWHGLEGRAKHERYGLMDITEHQTVDAPFVAARIPVRELLDLGADCAPATLYAHYAFFVDASFGVGALQHCGGAGQIRLGGMPDAQHPARIGLRDYTWDSLGLQPAYRIGSLGIAPPSAVWHSPQSLSVVKAIDYPPRQPVIAPERFSVSGHAAGAEAIIVAYRTPDYGPFRVVAARASGMTVTPVWEDPTTVIFRAPANLRRDAAVVWTLEIDATPAFVDVLTLSDQSTAGGQPGSD